MNYDVRQTFSCFIRLHSALYFLDILILWKVKYLFFFALSHSHVYVYTGLFFMWLRLSYSVDHLSRQTDSAQSFITLYCLSLFRSVLSCTKFVYLTRRRRLLFARIVPCLVHYVTSLFNLHLDRYLFFFFSCSFVQTLHLSSPGKKIFFLLVLWWT